jgi:CoA:oxalate CoA-transferase
VLTLEQLVEHDGFAAIAMTQQVGRAPGVTDDGSELTLQTTRSPIRIDGERLTSDRAAPKLGEHNASVWAEFLGRVPAGATSSTSAASSAAPEPIRPEVDVVPYPMDGAH